MERYDVVVAGAGVAGTVAAIQAARLGARTLLVERLSRVGGTATAAGVKAIGLFHAFGRRVVGGLGWAWLERAMAENGRPMPTFENVDTGGNAHNIFVDLSTFALIGDEMLGEAGVDVLFHAMPAAAARKGEHWRLTLARKEGLGEIEAAFLIDATGDANLAALAGCPTWREPVTQPASLHATLTGFAPGQVDWDALRAAYRRGEAEGLLHPSMFGWTGTDTATAQRGELRCEAMFRRGDTVNSHVLVEGAATSAERTDVERRAMAQLRRVARYFRSVPGLETLRVTDVAPETGIRESTRIVGVTPVTDDDYEKGRIWPDAVGYSFYPVDIHTWEGGGLIYKRLPPGVVPALPLGAMTPKGEGRLLACGRIVAGERRAFSAYRTMASCMVTGQGAGAVAALAARTGATADAVPRSSWQAALREHGAILPA